MNKKFQTFKKLGHLKRFVGDNNPDLFLAHGYKIIENIYNGGFGAIYLTKTKQNYTVVIKEQLKNVDNINQLKTEVGLMIKACIDKYPNVVWLGDFFEIEGSVMIVMEKFDLDLEDYMEMLIDARQNVSKEAIFQNNLHIVFQLFNGIKFFIENNLVHNEYSNKTA